MGPDNEVRLLTLQVTLLVFFTAHYLFLRDTESERERQRHRQKEKQAPCKEPDVGLNPGTPGSRPKPKAGAQSLSHPSVPDSGFVYQFVTSGHCSKDCPEKGKSTWKFVEVMQEASF